MKLLILCYALLICVISCKNEKDCLVDQYVKNSFEEKIRHIKALKTNEGFGPKTYLFLFFLEAVTGLKTSANYGDISVYVTKKDIRDDVKKWKNWYELNKCLLNPDTLALIELKLRDSNANWLEIE